MRWERGVAAGEGGPAAQGKGGRHGASCWLEEDPSAPRVTAVFLAWAAGPVHLGVPLHLVSCWGFLLAHLVLSQAFLSKPIFTKLCRLQPLSFSPAPVQCHCLGLDL